MGYRLHYAKHFDPQWQGGLFNHDSEKWSELFYAKFNENGWINDEGDQCEVYRADLESYIAELAKLKPNAKNEFFAGADGASYTNKELATELQEILNGSEDEYIRMEWF